VDRGLLTFEGRKRFLILPLFNLKALDFSFILCLGSGITNIYAQKNFKSAFVVNKEGVFF